ncbi:MAG TPA: enolase C-terminal domain-like protein [Xanthobacteraceae bacterium]|nr:enolase C-terminal domain-like protein [Xanthobacteraceae bacterium]
MLERTQSNVAAQTDRPLTIRRIDAIPVAVPLKAPMKMAGITITRAENMLVRVEAAGGEIGWGEAPSAPTMTGDTLGGLVAAVRDHLAPLLIAKDARADHRALLQRSLVGNTGAHSAVEMALLDLVGRASSKRLIDLVARPLRARVAPMWLLGNATPEQDIAEAKEKQAQGFDFFKLKIGVKPIAAEIAAAHAIRKALPDATLCADANCGLTLAAARRYAERTRDADLAFIEQPLPADDMAGLKALARASKTPIGMDESIQSLADIEAVKRAGAKGVSLKLIKLGGLRDAVAAGKLCRKLGLRINVAAKIAETSIGTAAAVHLACAVPNVAWGVSLTNLYLAADIVQRPIALSDGAVALPDGPGLGVEVDEAAVARFRVSTSC